MGLYNMMFGMNPFSGIILATLGLSIQDCGRFRDCFISEGRIAVYTRLGGGNRECYCDEGTTEHSCYQKNIQLLQSNKYYVEDKDDEFDCTYATFFFKFPEQFAEDLKRLDSGEKFDPDKKWQDLIEALEKTDKI